jgi:predicted dithiol-disulfide oxidoreductase (DUF899 family)
MGDDKDPVQAEIETLQQQILELRTQLSEARRSRPPERVQDYVLTTSDGDPVRLSELFGDKEDLIVVHNMGSACPMCTTWADGFNGQRAHLEDRAAFVVSTPDPPERQREFAASRGWTMRLVSTQDTSFARDLGMEGDGKDGKPFPYPGVSVFRRIPDDGVERVSWDFFGPGDDYCGMWSLMMLLPDGQGDWWPKIRYDA